MWEKRNEEEQGTAAGRAHILIDRKGRHRARARALPDPGAVKPGGTATATEIMK